MVVQAGWVDRGHGSERTDLRLRLEKRSLAPNSPTKTARNGPLSNTHQTNNGNGVQVPGYSSIHRTTKKDHREEQSKQQSLLVHDFRGGECWQDGKERASLKHPPNAQAGLRGFKKPERKSHGLGEAQESQSQLCRSPALTRTTRFHSGTLQS